MGGSLHHAAAPPPPPAFAHKKKRILDQLAIPDAEYTDASPKGSVDASIRDLIDEINGLDGFITTSSCAGRVSVFVEGRKKAGDDGEGREGEREEDAGEAGDAGAEGRRATTTAGVGGKGGGGTWLFVSHDPVPVPVDEGAREADWGALLGLDGPEIAEEEQAKGDHPRRASARLIHFKFEPMILHVLTASPEHAQPLLRCGLQAGFRESGALNLTGTATEPVTPIVAIRSMGLAFESLVGVQVDGISQCTVSPEYLQTLVQIANERFAENSKRIARFRTAVLETTEPPKKKDGSEWEDSQARRERKKAEGLRRKAEGLRRKAELQGQGQREEASEGYEVVDERGVDDLMLNTVLT
ncbi:Uu.00g113220.m01.CDS01 [Anthostomella pinea]|uniref:tRNA(Phe) 7-[(3-amino-3-carboxypropyl)-4-demethylwyosine(37)-N(4)]-methyltransferase n=1 Tax=Anthostomella pinea TaxID=933095 RepID=A0AAI8YE42_9PEZI|nr:Uu.00g113220.m01.CDS01 [Anthostomella pinea]